MFRLNRNERSHWSGNGVHVESELVFMIGRNMHRLHRQSVLPYQFLVIGLSISPYIAKPVFHAAMP